MILQAWAWMDGVGWRRRRPGLTQCVGQHGTSGPFDAIDTDDSEGGKVQEEELSHGMYTVFR